MMNDSVSKRSGTDFPWLRFGYGNFDICLGSIVWTPAQIGYLANCFPSRNQIQSRPPCIVFFADISYMPITNSATQRAWETGSLGIEATVHVLENHRGFRQATCPDDRPRLWVNDKFVRPQDPNRVILILAQIKRASYRLDFRQW